jgi:hypothetical protein
MTWIIPVFFSTGLSRTGFTMLLAAFFAILVSR